MSAAIVLAGLAGASAVVGAWHALAALDQARPERVVRGLLAPLRGAGRGGGQPTARERRRLAVLAAVTLLAAGWTVAGAPAGVLAAAAGPWAMTRVIAARRRRWRDELVADAPALARTIADAIGAGRSLRGAIAEAAAAGGLRPTAAGELRACATALALGEATEVTLDRLAQRAEHPAYDTIVAAVLMQREAGGDLAGLLRDTAGALEETRRVEDDARVATAQARFTAWIVAGLPVGAAAVIELVDPGALRSVVSQPPAAALAAVALACQLIGLVLMCRLARVGRP